MGKPSERIVIIESGPDGEVDRGQVLQVVSDFIGTLFAVGGKLQIGADRVIVGEVQVGSGTAPIAETQGLVFRYQSFSPARSAEQPAPPLEQQEQLEEPVDEPVAVDVELDPADAAPDRDDLLTDEEIRDLVAAEQAA